MLLLCWSSVADLLMRPTANEMGHITQVETAFTTLFKYQRILKTMKLQIEQLQTKLTILKDFVGMTFRRIVG